MAMMITIA